MRILIITVLAVLVFAAPVQAVELVNPDGTRAEPFQTWADSSRVPTPGLRALIETAPTQIVIACGNVVRSCAGTASGDFRLWMAANATPRVLLHEVGHLYDATMPLWKQRVFKRLTRGTRSWHFPLSEQFAVAYADCASGALPTSGEYEYRPSRSVHRRVCKLIRQPN